MKVWKCVRQTCFLAAVVTGIAGGQTFGAGLGVLSSSHVPLGGPLSGWQLSAGSALGEESAWRIGAMSYVGSAERSGSICAGLVMLGESCGNQPLRDIGHMDAGALGFVRQVVHRARVDLALTTDLSIARFTVESRAYSDGRTLAAEKLLGGVMLGVEGAWYPLAQSDVALSAGVGVASFMPLNRDQVLDGYEPFTDGLLATQFRIALTWRPH